MPIIEWNKQFSVNILSIDNQHKKLISIINDFYDNILKGQHKDKIPELISELKEYTIFHFKTEEKYMQLYNYPDYPDHLKEHKIFIDKVLSFEFRLKNGKMLLTVEITNFLKEWILDHIQHSDQKYSTYFIKMGVK
jgi:hemerythrin